MSLVEVNRSTADIAHWVEEIADARDDIERALKRIAEAEDNISGLCNTVDGEAEEIETYYKEAPVD